MHDLSWPQANLAAIERRLAWLKSQPDGTLHDAASALHQIRIVKHAGQVHFYFRDPATGTLEGPMSRIALDRPLHLLAEYTQAAMLVLLWQPDPRRICLIGLAGGRLSMIFYHHFPAAAIDNVDVDPAVAAIASRYFGLAFDQRQTITIADGRAYLAARDIAYDIIVMDAFRDDTDNLDHLATVEFYQECKARLARGGALCANLLKSDARFREKSRTFLASFRYVYAAELKRSVVLFGSDLRRLSAEENGQRAADLQRRHGFDFPFAERAAALRPARELAILSPQSLRAAPILSDALAGGSPR
jgi:spermidine synthase